MVVATPLGGTIQTVAFAFAVIWATILIHELGHYYAGRSIVEIPADRIKLVAPYFPRYVALSDGDEWVSPTDFSRYRAVYAEYDSEDAHERRFAAAGEVVQAGVIAPVGFGLGVLVNPTLGVTVLSASLLVSVVYAAIDAGATLYRGEPSGDYSLLWEVTPGLPVGLLLGFGGLHVIPLMLLT